MPLVPGSRLGPYEIVAAIGAGGMGEVYRARDVRLHREVAIKVLPGSFTDDSDRLRRFEQEARAASALNHPGILTIHDFGEHEGSPYVVSELLEGQTLRARLAEPLPVRRVIDYGIQIARGLAAAHEKGIVHRDLKPENVFVTRDGRVKILDFGLAKLMHPELAGESATKSPTLATEPGVLLGTVGYMSPEQVRGLPADHRSDVFSFGSIVSEMLTGLRAFEGASPVETMSAILREEPAALTDPSRKIPPDLIRVVHHCLEKEPHERFQSIGDVAFHLESLSTASAATTSMPFASSPGPRRTGWIAGVAGALAALALGYVLGILRRPTVEPRSVQVHRVTDLSGLEESPAISPDGKSVAFSSYVGNRRQISVRLVTGGQPLQITRDDVDHDSPRWAPDAASLLYFSPPQEAEPQGTIWEVAALGGSPRRIANSIGGADISHDGKRIAFFRSGEGRIELVTAGRDGADVKVVAKLPLGNYYVSPRWSPDDRSIAYQRGYVFAYDVFSVAAGGGEAKPITHEGRILSGFAWTPDGSGIVYSSARGSTVLYLPTANLWTVRLDGGGGVRQLTFGEASYVSPDVGAGGTIVASRLERQFNVWKFPVDGDPADNVRRAVQITHQTGQVQTPSVGASDKEVVYLSDSGGHGNLWVIDTETGATRQITSEQSPDTSLGVPVWSPDGRQIAFYTYKNGVGGNWLVNADGGNLRNIVPSGGWATWSRDGRWLYYTETGAAPDFAQLGIRKVRPEGGRSITVRTEKGNRPAISPDGSTLYFVVEKPTETGGSDYEVLAATPENGPSRVIARIPARRIPPWQLVHPVISPDGKWLAMPLTDGLATNIWTLPASGGEMRQLTDFGARATFIARRVSWSVDGKSVFAALGEGDADVVLLKGLVPEN